ncbi:MAG: riboflavin biosynthesis protein RibF [Defluviitaleaceae bacterium]|nr:riboflavin biosynthesis protein RibF [Defluviitaleaceae bacterium]
MIILRGKKICMPGPCVLAVGKFECFHLGHRALVAEMQRLTRDANGLVSALAMFRPHPYRLLVDTGYKPLFTDCEQEYLAGELNVDYLLEYPFDRDFAGISPVDFSRMIFTELNARVVVVGAGYRFGHKRRGTVQTLQEMAEKYNGRVHVVTPYGKSGHQNTQHDAIAAKTSTSSIRKLLSENRLSEAEGLLGYPFFVMGEVTPGRQLGRTIGFPTINLYPECEKFLPSDGVYSSRVIVGEVCYRGVTNIGFRPTVEGTGMPRSVETHLLDFDGGELYGRQVRVELLRFIRPERKFESLNKLKAQILLDCKQVLA